MAQQDPTRPILTHTSFKVSLGIDIYDIETGFEQGLPLFKALNTLLAAPARIRSFWGRISETPEEVLLVTAWYTRRALSDFESSPLYPTFLSSLSSNPTETPPITTYIDIGKQQIEAVLEGFTSITTLNLPAPVTPDQRAVFLALRGLRYDYAHGQGIMHLRADRAAPLKGWVEGVQGGEEAKYEVGILWHFWVDAEMEQGFHREEREVVERCERDMKGLGAVGWEELHCEFICLPGEACG
ncbi:MAG: hypothetical protein Q9218_005916 [Villophora microphyllina]